MATGTQSLSLPDVVGEDTIVNIQERVQEATKAAGKRPDGFFTRRELKKGELLFPLGKPADAIYMLRGGTVRLAAEPGRSIGSMPVTTVYSAAPDASANRPLLGARYYFTCAPVSLAYRAETPCTLYRITASSLEGLYQVDTQSVLHLMYWMIGWSDVSDLFLPIANKALGVEAYPVNETQGLLRASEEFLAARTDPKMGDLLCKLYDKFTEQRRKRAAELGIELSVVA